MSKQTVSGKDPVPRMWWIMVGGNGLAPPPTWDRFLSITAQRNKVRRDAEKEKRDFKEAQRAVKEELEKAKKTYKEAFGGGLAAWRQRNREAEANSDGTDGNGTGRDRQQRTQETTASDDGPESDS
ncbi:hypothetical protein CORC01_13717 [Colletotrichum orchidophilum]|uniref:Uncharacterized protein n=1 Tax=Colletotrichum orchidophilum TaxID=1209926 RepID=A0A1G4API4_9PEZI|nr:uncharacterized protein CORC01_13717 [Colletotrichum orchidophilum]OHE90973.1 hypothetical protein CORC01_13717 [Colletotrichum orchidophilum]